MHSGEYNYDFLKCVFRSLVLLPACLPAWLDIFYNKVLMEEAGAVVRLSLHVWVLPVTVSEQWQTNEAKWWWGFRKTEPPARWEEDVSNSWEKIRKLYFNRSTISGRGKLMSHSPYLLRLMSTITVQEKTLQSSNDYYETIINCCGVITSWGQC